jgi:hypothetical protein
MVRYRKLAAVGGVGVLPTKTGHSRGRGGSPHENWPQSGAWGFSPRKYTEPRAVVLFLALNSLLVRVRSMLGELPSDTKSPHF